MVPWPPEHLLVVLLRAAAAAARRRGPGGGGGVVAARGVEGRLLRQALEPRRKVRERHARVGLPKLTLRTTSAAQRWAVHAHSRRRPQTEHGGVRSQSPFCRQCSSFSAPVLQSSPRGPSVVLAHLLRRREERGAQPRERRRGLRDPAAAGAEHRLELGAKVLGERHVDLVNACGPAAAATTATRASRLRISADTHGSTRTERVSALAGNGGEGADGRCVSRVGCVR